MGYYDNSSGNWRYMSGFSIQHEKSYITIYNNELILIGGVNYYNVSVYLSSNDHVRRRYTGTTTGNDEVLWTPSGTYTPYPYQ